MLFNYLKINSLKNFSNDLYSKNFNDLRRAARGELATCDRNITRKLHFNLLKKTFYLVLLFPITISISVSKSEF
jgi:hypothetical protein